MKLCNVNHINRVIVAALFSSTLLISSVVQGAIGGVDRKPIYVESNGGARDIGNARIHSGLIGVAIKEMADEAIDPVQGDDTGLAEQKEANGARDIGNGGFATIGIDRELARCVVEGYAILDRNVLTYVPHLDRHSNFSRAIVDLNAFTIEELNSNKYHNMSADEATAAEFSDRAMADDSIRAFYEIESELDDLQLQLLVAMSFAETYCVKKDPSGFARKL